MFLLLLAELYYKFNNKNRMMGTNLYLKLESDGFILDKTILHDIVVYMRK